MRITIGDGDYIIVTGLFKACEKAKGQNQRMTILSGRKCIYTNEEGKCSGGSGERRTR
jgi:hypothetical protein